MKLAMKLGKGRKLLFFKEAMVLLLVLTLAGFQLALLPLCAWVFFHANYLTIY